MDGYCKIRNERITLTRLTFEELVQTTRRQTIKLTQSEKGSCRQQSMKEVPFLHNQMEEGT